MAWTVLSDATLEVGKALRALTMRNLRDNITALANGDAGAPQIQTAAIAASAVTAAKIADYNVGNAKLAAPQAGDGYLLRSLLGSVPAARTGNAYTPAWDDPVGNEAFFRAINYGSIRVRFQHYSGGTGAAFARIVVEGGVIAEWAGTGLNTLHNRVADFGISPGQRIVVQVRNEFANTSNLLNCNVFSSVMAVGVI